VFKVVEVRLRFIVILVATAFFVGYWDSIKDHWHKETRSDGRVYGVVKAALGERLSRWVWPDTSAGERTGADSEFYCPMHPTVVRSDRDASGAAPKCPICGMPLSQRKKGQSANLPDGILSRKQYSPDQIRLAGVKTVAVTFQPLTKQLSAVGNVTYDESRLAEITSRVSGWLEKVYVNKTWIAVKEGEPLVEIYSPELFSSARELLLAMERKGSGELVKGVREKLRLLGVSDSEIEEIAQSGRANHRLIIRSPQSGHIIRKEVKQGVHVEPGETLFEVADLSAVWIEADVFERDIPLLRVGQAIEATVQAIPNRVFEGRVSLVHPHLDPTTRTNGVRFEVENSKHDLRPGMFATVQIKTPLSEIELFATQARRGEVLAVPERAVVDTGTRTIVYVERDAGTFEGVEVKLGPRCGDYYPVAHGLAAGDRVAAAGAFLVDAETRLNPAAAGTYIGASGRHQGTNRASAARRMAADEQLPSTVETAAGPASAASKRPAPDELKNIAELNIPDRDLARAQRVCPISSQPLGSMGVPRKVMAQGQPVFLCCEACEAEVRKNPQKVLAKLSALKPADEPDPAAAGAPDISK
jgi:multidrug efflux pump subunit AcrA (membrane-fusion protein)